MNHGFGNYFTTEAIKGALPLQQNSPQQHPYQLYSEQMNGSSFTQSRSRNLHTWLYRTKPSATFHEEPYTLSPHQWIKPLDENSPPNPMRWSNIEANNRHLEFISSMTHIASSGKEKTIFIYQMTQSMEDTFFMNNDGEMLFIPYEGEISFYTEMGILNCRPGEIVVIPRGVGFKIGLLSAKAYGYVAENGGAPFELPELGILGANGLANPRHFNYPVAHFESKKTKAKLYCKYQNKLWQKNISSSILNVVAWHGNYAPYRYDLKLFNTINTVSFDHPDPSIFTVLSSRSSVEGVASLDFGIFPSRWMVALHTFRLPYFHRNIMSEFMGLITGEYDAKDRAFEVGGFSIHNQMVAHGPDYKSFKEEKIRKDEPRYLDNSLAFILESNAIWVPSYEMMKHTSYQENYGKCWQGFPISDGL